MLFRSDSIVPLERHHIVSQDTLKKLGEDPKKTLSVQMTPSQHQNTLSWGSSKDAKAYRATELARMQNGDETGVVLDELARVEAMGGDNVGSAHDALDLYIKNGLQQP